MHVRHLFQRRFAVSAALSATVAVGVLAGCGASNTSTSSGPFSAAKGCKKIGFLLPESATSARWEGNDHPDMVAAIQKYLPGATLDVTNAEGSASTQLTQAEADLTKGDCILVVAASDSQQAAAIVDKAAAAHVPVIAYDRLIQDKTLAYYVSFDNVQVGVLQGQYIQQHYQSFVSSQGTTNVVMINGSPTDNNATLFKQGVHSILDPLFTAGTLTKAYEISTPGWDNPTAQTEMEAALTQLNNKVAVAYVANDGMAGTVIAALKAHGLAGKVLVTGQDATAAGFQNILLGYQSMTVYKAINLEADASAQLVAALSNGTDTASLTNGKTTTTSDGTAIPSVLKTPIAVDATNIASTVLADGFVTKAAICEGVPAGTDGIC